ncbi:uncharacterized protein BDZ99DRAFT_516629 [Mytilinidion resinicola]|uniref:Uncharacterized protein n=1 Tax=Mytilinidion resinicola TaxID=574789 RepID=A0A6A6Z1A0_9PEZI|nr:uncharacterized protein BDZ99DRAFT_516629 [Mytilinidion resinicola]KAF2814007.1 hypothetical protein BDZ99DRAFT_516629 [Mytilinidion resinicola]
MKLLSLPAFTLLFAWSSAATLNTPRGEDPSFVLFTTKTGTTRPDAYPPGSGVYMCKDPNWGGCVQAPLPDLKEHPEVWCIGITGSWDNAISAFGPDKGLLCTIWDASACTGGGYDIRWPGIPDLRTVGWDDKISSF